MAHRLRRPSCSLPPKDHMPLRYEHRILSAEAATTLHKSFQPFVLCGSMFLRALHLELAGACRGDDRSVPPLYNLVMQSPGQPSTTAMLFQLRMLKIAGACQRKFFLFNFNLLHSPTLTRFPSQSAWPDTSQSSRPDIMAESWIVLA